MKQLLLTIILIIALLSSGCSIKTDLAGTSSEEGIPLNPPLPPIPSIIPMNLGNCWWFTTHIYDTGTGSVQFSHFSDTSIKIPRAYGVKKDSLITINWKNSEDYFDEIYYVYQYYNRNSSYLFSFKENARNTPPGLYAVGTINLVNDSISLFDNAFLLLAYPADSGFKWHYNPDPSGDSTHICSVEVISNNARFYVPESEHDNSLPHRFYSDCYLYKEVQGKEVRYGYFHKTLGQLSYVRYINGKLRETQMFSAFRETQVSGEPD